MNKIVCLGILCLCLSGWESCTQHKEHKEIDFEKREEVNKEHNHAQPKAARIAPGGIPDRRAERANNSADSTRSVKLRPADYGGKGI